MEIDAFSRILKFANAETVISGSFTAGGSWAIHYPALNKIQFFGLVKGGCWLCVDSQKAPVRIEAGDVFLLSTRQSFILAGDLAAVPMDARRLFAGGGGEDVRIGEGEDCIQVGGHVRLDAASGALLSDVLPPLIHVRAVSPNATVPRWLLEQLARERASELPGASLASAQLALLMFVEILRAYVETSDALTSGWLRAVGDPGIASALRLMHGDPGRSWRLEELAKAAGMSRTSFALRFKTLAGVAPLAYLTEWRMRLAERALREENLSVAAVARSVGYASESAFSHAFRRSSGVAPKRYKMVARAADRETGPRLPSIEDLRLYGEGDSPDGVASDAPAREGKDAGSALNYGFSRSHDESIIADEDDDELEIGSEGGADPPGAGPEMVDGVSGEIVIDPRDGIAALVHAQSGAARAAGTPTMPGGTAGVSGRLATMSPAANHHSSKRAYLEISFGLETVVRVKGVAVEFLDADYTDT